MHRHEREDSPCHGMERLAKDLSSKLQNLKTRNLYRHLVSPQSGIVDLTHNDYLGLKDDENWQKTLRSHVSLPLGSGGSRLLGGNASVFSVAEEAFTRFKKCESSLFFSNGFSANLSVTSALAQPGYGFYSDQLNHASTIDGIRSSPMPKENRYIFPHGDFESLESMLKKSPHEVNVIFTESLYSMDGDTPDLAQLWNLSRTYRGLLVIDESHAVGCLGPEGRGLSYFLPQDQIITVNGCGKALAAQGAFVCGPQWFRDYLINTARSFIYSTAPSPWIVEGLLATLRHLSCLEKRRIKLQSNCKSVYARLQEQGWETKSTHHIIPLLTYSPEETFALQRFFYERGFLVSSIRPPTVPKGQCRLRLSLNYGLSEAALGKLIACLPRKG